uniref:Uncharacterized protein n=1 Tax=Arundo donax TaxID=35708 RepID=A0A0A9BWA6_ARUDO
MSEITEKENGERCRFTIQFVLSFHIIQIKLTFAPEIL